MSIETAVTRLLGKATFGAGSLKMAALDDNMAEGKVEAGQSAGLVDDLAPAGELVRRIAQEYLDAVGRMPRLAPSATMRAT